MILTLISCKKVVPIRIAELWCLKVTKLQKAVRPKTKIGHSLLPQCENYRLTIFFKNFVKPPFPAYRSITYNQIYFTKYFASEIDYLYFPHCAAY